MRKILSKIAIALLIIVSLSGCRGIIPEPIEPPDGNSITSSWFYDLNDFVIPDDAEFMAAVESTTTPKEIVEFMNDNFEWVFASWWCYNPYQMWWANTKAGDCNDMSNYAVWVADYHGYETYQIHVHYEGKFISHFLGVFVEDGVMNYSSNTRYHKLQTLSFEAIAKHNCIVFGEKLRKYRVYDFNMNIIKEYYD